MTSQCPLVLEKSSSIFFDYLYDIKLFPLQNYG